jgi:subtilisin family serine protease
MICSVKFRYTLIALMIFLAAGALLMGSGGFITPASAQSGITSVIVELRSDPVVVARAKAQAASRSFNEATYRQQVINEQQQFLNRLTAAGVPYTVSSVLAPNGLVTPQLQYRFNYVFNGITLDLPSSLIQQIMPIIAALPEVYAIHPNEPVYIQLNRAVDYTRAPNLYGNPPRLTQFDTLNSGGVHGEGVNIAIIDTGVDWTHDMFGGDPTPPQYGAAPTVAALNINRKVIYYMNFTPAVAPDDFGHGSHVAGIAAGYRAFAPGADSLPMTADDIAVHGAAPQARIMAYKTLTAAGVGVSASIVAAIEDAVQPRTITGFPKPVAHVINMSLGTQTPSGPEYPTSVAADNAALAGCIVVASAGNSGVGDQTTGVGAVGAPGSGRRVITVGANIDPGAGPNSIDVVGGGRTGMKAYLMAGSTDIPSDITNNYVFCGLAETPDQVPDTVNGKIALIARGSTVTVDAAGVGTGLASNKVAFAAAKGAVAAIIYNNVDGEITNLTVRRSIIPAVGISKDNGEYLKSLIGSTTFGAVSQQQIRLNKAQIFEPAMGDFSSRGPVLGYGQVKPDVSAPGVNILSATVAVGGVQTNATYMMDPTRYASVSGTSMSSPMTAGIVALIKQKNPAWTPSMVRAALVNTATNLREVNGAPVADGTHTINDQGGGLVDAVAAANAKALMGAGQPGPTTQPQGRSYGICTVVTGGAVASFCGTAANPDFTPSYSFGTVPIANVIGTASISQEVRIFDITSGGGAGTYNLSVSNVRGVDQNGFRVSFTDANGNALSSVQVPSGGYASFFVKTEANGESITAAASQFQWYVTAQRASGGQNLRMPFYYRAVAPTVTLAAPTLAANGAEVTGSPAIDINGSYSLSYAAAGSPAKYRIEEQAGSNAFTRVGDVDAGQTSYAVTGRGNGVYSYRVAGLFPVQYGLLQGSYSAAQTIQVDRRIESNVSSMIQTAVSNVSLAGGVFEFDQTLKNTSSGAIQPPLRFSITAIQSTSGTVRVSNADNGGSGVESPAVFDYSNTLGGDRSLTANETSGALHLKFTNPASELFQFTAVVKGHFADPAFAAARRDSGANRARQFKVRLRFIANPATGSVSLAGTD